MATTPAPPSMDIQSPYGFFSFFETRAPALARILLAHERSILPAPVVLMSSKVVDVRGCLLFMTTPQVLVQRGAACFFKQILEH